MIPVNGPETIFVILTLLTTTAALDVTLQKYDKSPELYYGHIGEAQLYDTEWKLLSYVDLQEADRNLETVVKYAELSKEFCMKHEHSFWVNLTDCLRITRYTDRKVRKVQELKELVRQLTRVEEKTPSRSKRGVFNFLGAICKIMFGTMDSNDASYYAEVSDLEKEELEFLSLSKEHVTVVKTTLRSLNSTLLAVSENEIMLSKGLDEMVKHISEHDGEIRDMFTGKSMLLTVNEHNMQLERALGECRREYDILIDAILNSQKGILQPLIITPAQFVKQIIASQSDIPG
jgi:vacuolar-type H+-ATPase subunit I/STV1